MGYAAFAASRAGCAASAPFAEGTAPALITVVGPITTVDPPAIFTLPPKLCMLRVPVCALRLACAAASKFKAAPLFTLRAAPLSMLRTWPLLMLRACVDSMNMSVPDLMWNAPSKLCSFISDVANCSIFWLAVILTEPHAYWFMSPPFTPSRMPKLA